MVECSKISLSIIKYKCYLHLSDLGLLQFPELPRSFVRAQVKRDSRLSCGFPCCVLIGVMIKTGLAGRVDARADPREEPGTPLCLVCTVFS